MTRGWLFSLTSINLCLTNTILVRKNSTLVSTGPVDQINTPTKRNGADKIEPSKVVVFPDSAVHGTDTTNMQIKEFHPKGGKAKWLAVHIPDIMPYPRKNLKIFASKNAAKDLQRVVGPNKASLAMEIQSILGVDEDTLHRMITQGESNDGMNKGEDDDDDGEDEERDEDEGDTDNSDNDAMGDPLNDVETSESCDDSEYIKDTKGNKGTFSDKLRKAKMCKAKNKSTRKIHDGSANVNRLREDEDDQDRPKVHVEQPLGFELRWEDVLNNFKNFNAKRKRKICKLFDLQNDVCTRVRRHRKRNFTKRLKHYLLQMLTKFLKKNKNDFQDYLSGE